jgi:hypothetical protein
MKRLKEEKTIYLFAILWCAALAVLCPSSVPAAGTPAGVTISSIATVSYTLGSDPTIRTASASDSFEVIEVINLAAVWQDAADIPVPSPRSGAVLSFLVTNTGNGPEDVRLSTSDAVAGDDFDPAVQAIWLESNGTAGLQTDDTAYAGAVSLAADQAVVVYVSSDIPDLRSHGETGRVELTAEADTPGAAGQPAGTLLSGAGWNGADAVVGLTRAVGRAAGIYRVSTLTVTLTKSIQAIADTHGDERPENDARITYRIRVDVGGEGAAESLVITDAIPSELAYAGGTIRLDGVSLTDAADGDNAEYDAADSTVSVQLGDITAPAVCVIEFEATIQP